MMRCKDWPSRFAALVESARRRQFAWGTHDCVMWSAAAYQALTGWDIAHERRGTYSDEAGAARVVLAMGGLPCIAALAGPEISPALATTGDIGLVRWPNRVISLGVCGGASWLCVGDAGLVNLEFDSALRVWGVGCV